MSKNKISLIDVEKSNNNIAEQFDFEKEKLIDNLKITKRDGRIVKYDIQKMHKVCLWACDNNESNVQHLLTATRIKLYDEIKISDVYDELIRTAVNNISRIQPQYEDIASKLLLLKIYKETWDEKNINLKNEMTSYYPKFKDVIKKGLDNNIYNNDIYNTYSDEEIQTLEKIIKPQRDTLFKYKSLYMFFEKYCKNITKTKKFELPQHAYMRVAMSLFYTEEKNKRLEYIKNFYEIISNHDITLATPIMLNSGTNKMQLASCVLMSTDDDTNSILNTAKNLAVYSKNKGGIAIDISSIRSSGSKIGNNGDYSTGPVSFVKIFESTIKAFNQGSHRPGACALYFQWWNSNFQDLVVLKNNNGTEENRARNLKYGVKINQLLIDRVLKNQKISLFDPKDVPELLSCYGDKFNQLYIKYENDPKISKKTINARKIIGLLFKERVETGNIYLFHEENVNEPSMLNEYIPSSNLCTEITLPSSASKEIETYFDPENPEIIINKKNAGDISLCNLASINLLNYFSSDTKTKKNITNLIIRALDNTIDIAMYPVIEAQKTNQNFRYLGVGILNLTNYLATKKIIIDSKEALEENHKIMDEISYELINSSADLAIERGAFNNFKKTKWADGDLPIYRANENALKLTNYQPDMKKWKELSNKIKKSGLRNAQIMAIAPTATSGKIINATESIEPIQNFIYKEDGKINLPTLAPNLKNNWKYYKIATDCDQYMLLKNAAIRQCYLDQSQSINSYFTKVKSLTDFSLFHFYGFHLGIKTFYYCKTEKDSIEEICDSCT